MHRVGGDADALGVLMGFGAAVCYTGYILTGDHLVQSLSPLVLAALVTAGGTVVSVGALLAGTERVGASTASVLSTVEPATTVLLAIVFLHESAAAVQLVGGGLLVVAVVLCHRATRPVVDIELIPGAPA